MKIIKKKSTNTIMTPKEILFVKEYLKDLNATQAYIRAGYICKNPKSTHTYACMLLAKPIINKEIQKAFTKKTEKIDLSVEMIIKELHGIATSNVADMFEKDGKLKNIHDMPLHIQKAISAFDTEELYEWVESTSGRKVREISGQLKKVKLWEKTKSLELLGKYLAMWIDKQINGNGEMDDKSFRDKFFNVPQQGEVK